ncbi:MAG: PKD domain-containing protein [Solirubrobacteraceae bacterium]
MRLIPRWMWLAAAISIAAAARPVTALADSAACQPGASPGGDPSTAGGVNIHETANGSGFWCSPQVIDANSDVPDATQYPLHSADSSPSDNPVAQAISVSKLLTLAGVDPATVNHTELARLGGGATSLNTADLTDPADHFLDGLAPIFWINGAETDYTRPLRSAADTNGDDQIVASNGAPLDLYIYSGPVLEVKVRAVPTKAAVNQRVTFTARVANATPHDGTLTYTWDFQDGTAATGATATHRYAAAGRWHATVTVQGDANDSGGVSEPVAVTVGSVPKGAGPGQSGGTKHSTHPRSAGPKQGQGQTPGTPPSRHPAGASATNNSSAPPRAARGSGEVAASPALTPPAAIAPTTIAPTPTSPAVAPTPRPPAPRKVKLAPAAHHGTEVEGRLIADVIPVSPAQLAARDGVRASPPAATLGGGSATPVGVIAGVSVVLALLAAGAGMELRSQRRAVLPTRRA